MAKNLPLQNLGIALAFVLAVCCRIVGLGPIAALAQEEDPPRLVLTTGGPVAPDRALAFAPTSDRFYAAGEDKVVRVWDVTATGAQKGVQAVLADHLRWEIARGFRGSIQALAVSPAGNRLALAGVSARDASGNIVIYDTALGDVEGVLRGHRQTIVSLAFAPGGERLASVSKDGETRVWSVGDWSSSTVRPADDRLSDPRPAMFLADGRLAIAVPDPDEPESRWWIALYDVKAPGSAAQRLSTVHLGRVMALARDGQSSRWASADAAGKIHVWSGGNAPASQLSQPGRIVTSLAFGAGGRLFFTTRSNRPEPSLLELWDVDRRQRIDRVPLAAGDDNAICAASADGRYVVAYSPREGEVILFSLYDSKRVPYDKPLSAGSLVRLRGSGQRVWKVAFDAGKTYRIGLGTAPRGHDSSSLGDSGTIDQVFDPLKGDLVPAAQVRIAWRAHDQNSDGWTVSPDEKLRTLALWWQGRRQGEIRLDPDFQGRARSYGWLGDDRGQTYGIAVGTDLQHGVFVYALPQAGTCRLLRYFRDHQGWVTSLSVSHDGRYLASASVDQTVKIWSLEGVTAAGRGFAREDAWGAVVQARPVEKDLLVSSVHKAGIAARRGLQAGDTIIAVQLLREGKIVRLTDGQEMQRALEEHPIWDQVLLSVQEGGKGRAQRILLVPAWEPLMTLFVDRHSDWALWTPQGYYEASVSGDELFGWQINRGADVRPQFFRADRFRRQLERPQILRQLLLRGNLPDALAAADGSEPRNIQDPVSELAQAQPEVQILRPRCNARLGAGETIEVLAQVQFVNASQLQDFDVTCYVNRVPLGESAKRLSGRVGEYQWRLAPLDEYNQVRVIAEHKEHRCDSVFAHADAQIRAPATARKPPRIHVLALAANKYNNDDIKLEFAVADAESLIEKLRQSAGDYYSVGTVTLLRDQEITRRRVDEVITATRRELQHADPRDLLVAFVAGHGIAAGGEYYFVPPDARLKGLDLGVAQAVGIPWSDLRRLGAVPCRKLFLLDTCYAGNTALFEDNALYHLKQAIRPIKRTESVVVCATSVGQASFEEMSLRHGLFTHGLLAGLDGPADGYCESGFAPTTQDRIVDLAELVHYVVHRVPEIAAQLGERQQPIVSPCDVWAVPLTRAKP